MNANKELAMTDETMRTDITDAGVDACFRAAKVRNDLLAVGQNLSGIKPGEVMALTSMLDSIAQLAAELRGEVEHGSGAKKAALVRRVRKALGYTYP